MRTKMAQKLPFSQFSGYFFVLSGTNLGWRVSFLFAFWGLFLGFLVSVTGPQDHNTLGRWLMEFYFYLTYVAMSLVLLHSQA